MRLARHHDLALVTLGCLLAVAMAVLELPVAIRAPVGIVAVLILPGYSVSMALFLPGELDSIERSALAFSLSLGLLIILAPILNVRPAGFDARSIVGAVTAVTLSSTAIAWSRRRRRPAPLNLPESTLVRRARWRGAAGRTAAVVVGIVAISSVALLAFDLAARPGSTTEFYVLGTESATPGLPVRITAGTPTTLTVGISNHDDSGQPYRIVVETGSDQIAAIGPITLGSGETWNGNVDFTVPAEQGQQEIRILLLRDSDSDGQPYRSLRLKVDPSPPG